MKVLRFTAVLLAFATLWLAPGCGRGGNTVTGDETNDPVYQQAQDLKKQGRYNEALSAFLKVIGRRGEAGAPESHLEAGALYLNWSHNPVEAYHHFSRYLELQPTGPRSSIVRGQREAAMREIARFLLVPTNAQGGLERNEDVEQLRRRVQELEAENQTLRGSSGVPVMRGAPPMIALPDETPAGAVEEPPVAEITPAPAEPGATEGSFVRNFGQPAQTVRSPAANRPAPTTTAPSTAANTPVRSPVVTTPVRGGGERMAVPPTRPGSPQRPATGPSGGARSHTVTSAEKSLWGIARQYYGSVNQARVNAIYEANRDVMRSPNDLRPGMVLRIP